MVTSSPTIPLLLADFFLDTGTLHLAGKSLPFKGVDYVKGVVSAGNISRSIPMPSGLVQTDDAEVTVADPNGTLKTYFDTTTPFRRLVALTPELQEHDTDMTPNLPIFTGEILGFNCPPGEVTVRLRSITTSWMNRAVQHLVTRDVFPNLPDDVASAFAPIIFGRCFSYATTHVEPQGAIQCTLVNTATNDYLVARHECYSIPAVYRKKPLEQRFTLVDSSEYTTLTVSMTIGGDDYQMQMIRFAVQQYDGTVIQCDASGANSRWDFGADDLAYPVEVRNPADCLVNLIYNTLQNETNIERFDADSFLEVKSRCSTRGYVCDGAITGKNNSLEVITVGNCISRLCESFNIDFLQTAAGLIKVQLFDLTIDGPLAIPVGPDLILKKTFTPASPAKVFNHIDYRYFRENAGLPREMADRGNKEWNFKYIIRNTHDQTELAATGANPKLDTTVELYFVRDDAVAVDVIKKKIPYYTLRSYDVDFVLPAFSGGAFVGLSVDLGQACNLESYWGMGDGGFVDALSRIKAVSLDLKTWDLNCKAVIYYPTTDGDLDIEFSSHASHAAQTRKPQHSVVVNGATTVTAPRGVNFNTTTPSPPTGYLNVIFQEDDTVEPRKISGYVPINGSVDLTDLEARVTALEFEMAAAEARLDSDEDSLDIIFGHVFFTETSGISGFGDSWIDDYINDLYPRLTYSGTITYGGSSGASALLLVHNIQELGDAVENAISWLDHLISGIVTADGLVTTTALATALGAYTTTTALTTLLAGYETTAALTTTLASYETTAALATTLGSYVLTSTLTTLKGGYTGTLQNIVDMFDDYCTCADTADAIALGVSNAEDYTDALAVTINTYLSDDYITVLEDVFDGRYLLATDDYALTTYVDGGDSFLQGQIDTLDSEFASIDLTDYVLWSDLTAAYWDASQVVTWVEGNYYDTTSIDAGFTAVQDEINTLDTEVGSLESRVAHLEDYVFCMSEITFIFAACGSF